MNNSILSVTTIAAACVGLGLTAPGASVSGDRVPGPPPGHSLRAETAQASSTAIEMPALSPTDAVQRLSTTISEVIRETETHPVITLKRVVPTPTPVPAAVTPKVVPNPAPAVKVAPKVTAPAVKVTPKTTPSAPVHMTPHEECQARVDAEVPTTLIPAGWSVKCVATLPNVVLGSPVPASQSLAGLTLSDQKTILVRDSAHAWKRLIHHEAAHAWAAAAPDRNPAIVTLYGTPLDSADYTVSSSERFAADMALCQTGLADPVIPHTRPCSAVLGLVGGAR